jgi:hypothetical protein
VKLIRVKESLSKLSQAYLELSAKCNIIFESHQDVVNQMPEVQDKNIHDLKYAGTIFWIALNKNAKIKLKLTGKPKTVSSSQSWLQNSWKFVAHLLFSVKFESLQILGF